MTSLDSFDYRVNAISNLDLRDVIIAIDFDGTCVTHEFPEVGETVPGAENVIQALAAAGAKLIVWTIRSDQAKIKADPHSFANGTAGESLDLEFLVKAVKWFADRGIPLYGINENPQQAEWSSSHKCYAHAYIDDAALGCPLIYGVHSRPYVDWDAMCSLLIDRFLVNGAF